nr:hypothetical protein [uncultured Draconibacterium sp.]
MQSKEEYLLKFEERLINQLTDIFKNQNKNLLTVYVLTGFYILFLFGFINNSKVNIFNNEITIDINELKLLFPFILLVIFLFINFQTIRIAKTIQIIKNNSYEIIKLNPNSRPILSEDIFYFSSGLAGLVLAFSKWQFSSITKKKFLFKIKEVYSTNNFLFFLWKLSRYLYLLINWFFWSLIRFSIIICFYVLPIIVCILTIENNDTETVLNTLQKCIIYSVLGVIMLSTIVSVSILIIIYLNDLIKSFSSKFSDLINEIKSHNFNEQLIASISSLNQILIKILMG